MAEGTPRAGVAPHGPEEVGYNPRSAFGQKRGKSGYYAPTLGVRLKLSKKPIVLAVVVWLLPLCIHARRFNKTGGNIGLMVSTLVFGHYWNKSQVMGSFCDMMVMGS